MADNPKIIIGLGNFGDKYAYTYHNLGFLAAECLANRLAFKFKKKECDSLVAAGRFEGSDIIIAKPLTYMNLSGTAAKQLLKKYGASMDGLIVIYDDIDIEKAALRVRMNGSAGTHNGMRNIVELLGGSDFARVRIGIGRPPAPEMNLADYVLSDIPKSERELFAAAIERAADEAIKLISLQ